MSDPVLEAMQKDIKQLLEVVNVQGAKTDSQFKNVFEKIDVQGARLEEVIRSVHELETKTDQRFDRIEIRMEGMFETLRHSIHDVLETVNGFATQMERRVERLESNTLQPLPRVF